MNTKEPTMTPLPLVRKVVSTTARAFAPDRFQYLGEDGEYHEVPLVLVDEPLVEVPSDGE
jgi:hypothetical protein